MSQQILQVDQAMLETTLDRMVRKSVEETLNAMLDAEADEITGAARYVFLVKSVFRVSSLIFFGFRHEECRPVVCFTGCPSCRT